MDAEVYPTRQQVSYLTFTKRNCLPWHTFEDSIVVLSISYIFLTVQPTARCVAPDTCCFGYVWSVPFSIVVARLQIAMTLLLWDLRDKGSVRQRTSNVLQDQHFQGTLYQISQTLRRICSIRSTTDLRLHGCYSNVRHQDCILTF